MLSSQWGFVSILKRKRESVSIFVVSDYNSRDGDRSPNLRKASKKNIHNKGLSFNRFF